MGSLRSTGHIRTARKIVAASMSVVLAALIVLTGTPGGLSQAAAATGEVTWDSRADFETNASTTEATTTISGVSAQRAPGSVTLPGPIVSVAAGNSHTVGLKSDGTVIAVGYNAYGQTDVSTWTDVVSVAAGGYHTVGLRSDGTVVAVGRNNSGQTSISTWTDIVSVSAGYGHTVGLKSDGTVVAVGYDGSGQTDVSTWTDIVSVSAGDDHTVGLKSDGTVVAVGLNGYGQTDVSTWTDIVSVSAAYLHTVGLKSDGTVVAVGYNGSGQTGVSTWTDIVSVSAGDDHTVGLKSDGTVVAVGNNDSGQTNVSTWTDIVSVSAGRLHTVGLKSDGTVVAVGHNGYGQTNVSTWTDVVSVAAGGDHTVGLKSDGTVVAVGRNDYGQTGVSNWTDIVSVSAGSYHTVGLKSDGTVEAVGNNDGGQTGVSTWTDIVSVSAGHAHTVGLKSDGTVVAVGYNYYGQTDVSTWTDIVSVSASGYHTVGLKSDGTVVAVGYSEEGQTDVSTWTDIVSVSAGYLHTVGLKSDDTVVAVGSNGAGQTNVSTWPDIVSVSAGYLHTVGLKSDGTVVAVGLNDEGQTNVSTWTDIVSASAGGYHTVGLKSDGTVVAVGRNAYGQTDVSTWVSITGADPRSGSIGGSGPAVGLRAKAKGGPSGWATLDAVTSVLGQSQAVKFAVRLSDDGVTWSAPFGSDGEAIDWTNGSGNYLGRAVTDASARTDLSALPASAYIDIVVRLETAGTLTPELKSVTLGYQLNEAPVAVDDAYSTSEDTALVIAAPGVLGNDTNAETNQTLTVTSFSRPSTGTLSATSTAGAFTYTPPAEHFGTVTFTYVTSDGAGGSDTATVTIDVASVDDAPQAPTNVKYTLSGTKTLITWTKSADALGYRIYVNGRLAGTRGATVSSLTYAGLLGTNSKVEVQAVGKESLTSAKVKGAYVASGYTKVRTVRFDAYSARLSTIDKRVLRDMASLVASRGYTKVFIGGHTSTTDALGVSAYSKWISGARAEAAKKYLAAQLARRGSKATIYTKGYGPSRPVASNKTRQGRRLNQRAEIYVK